jgi:hypothetical protein
MSELEDGDWGSLEAAYTGAQEDLWIAKQESLAEGVTENDDPLIDYAALEEALNGVLVLLGRDDLTGKRRFVRALDASLNLVIQAFEGTPFLSHGGVQIKLKLAEILEAAAARGPNGYK